MIGDDLIISIHALLAESDFIWVDKTQSPANFYPRSPCGERQAVCNQLLFDTLISIHALLAESDSQPCCTDTTSTISIHALLAESDLIRPYANFAKPGFLSTLSLRRATPRPCTLGWFQYQFLSTLSLRRATCSRPSRPSRPPAFLSTLSLRRATTSQVPTWFGMPYFYPRSPCGERQSSYQDHP